MTSHASDSNAAGDGWSEGFAAGLLAELAQDLEALRIERGDLSLREISAVAPKDAPVSYTTVRRILLGEKVPRQEHLLALVRTLLALDHDGRFVATVKRADPRLKPWRERWRALRHAQSTASHTPDRPSADTPGDNAVPAPADNRIVDPPGHVPWVPTVAERAIHARLNRGAGGICVVPLLSFYGGSVLAFSSDGALLAAGGFGNSECVGLWDPATRERISDLTAHGQGPVEAVAFSPVGAVLAIGGHDESVRLWDSASRRQIGELAGHEGTERHLAFSPDGTMLATGDGRHVRLWDPISCRLVREPLFAPGSRLQSLAFSPDGTKLATGDAGGIRLWDLTSSNSMFTDSVRIAGDGASMAFSPDGMKLAVCGFDGCLRLLELPSGHQIGEPLKAHSGSMNAVVVAFSPNGALLATGGKEASARLWDPVSHRQISELPGHGYDGDGSVLSVAFSPDSTLLVTGDDTGTVRQWAILGTL